MNALFFLKGELQTDQLLSCTRAKASAIEKAVNHGSIKKAPLRVLFNSFVTLLLFSFFIVSIQCP